MLRETVGRCLPVPEATVDEVFEHQARGAALVRLPALVEEGVDDAMGHEQLARGRDGDRILLIIPCGQGDAVCPLELVTGHAGAELLHRGVVVAHLVYGQHSVAVHLGAAAGEVWEDETRAVADEEVRLIGAGKRLEVLRLAWCCTHAHLLGGAQRVDGGRLAHVGVAHEAHVPAEDLVAWHAHVHGGLHLALRAESQEECEDLIAVVHMGLVEEEGSGLLVHLARLTLCAGRRSGGSLGSRRVRLRCLCGLGKGCARRGFDVLRVLALHGIVSQLSGVRDDGAHVRSLGCGHLLVGCEGGEEGEAHALAPEVGGPPLPELRGQQVCLVEEQQGPLAHRCRGGANAHRVQMRRRCASLRGRALGGRALEVLRYPGYLLFRSLSVFLTLVQPGHGSVPQVGCVEVSHIMIQVIALEEERVARIHNLHHQIGPLEHAPQLAPHFQVALKGRQ
mmetsp:Transcript_6840/g.18506  ORF Transcript_6840/g.18506 Transcript_6840/m.18506 type:complete len:450 (+) Transcript_6840:405-1754(+)